MKIGLIDVDGHNFPNLALMKISAFHKEKGDSVEWVNHWERYDKVYKSKVFTFTPDNTIAVQSDEIIKGGTGYKIYRDLFCDDSEPDYTLYPQYSHAYGFLTRGCIRRCKWCIVPKKEGYIRAYRDIETVLQGRKTVILMDNNILACDYGISQLEKIATIGCRIDLNQGLDARIILNNAVIPKLLSRIKWLCPVRLACDDISMMKTIEEAAKLLRASGLKPKRLFAYVLLTDIQSSYERINFLKNLNIMPFAQPYRDFTPKQIIPQWQKDMARWCNDKALLQSHDFKNYMPRKGFRCSQYFDNPILN